MTPSKYSIAPGHLGPRKVSPNIRTDIGPWVSSTAERRPRLRLKGLNIMLAVT